MLPCAMIAVGLSCRIMFIAQAACRGVLFLPVERDGGVSLVAYLQQQRTEPQVGS